MGVLEALGGWQNVNQEKLEQIKVDNPPLYGAISKAINLLAKKYGGEDIIIQKPIEVVEEVIPATQQNQLTDYKILKKVEILSETKRDSPTKMEILDSFIYEIGFDENEIGAISDFEQDFYAKLASLVGRGLLDKIGNQYFITYRGEALIDSYELQNKQVEENRESRELSDLEKSILLSQRKRGTESSFKDIFDSVEKVALQKFQLDISYLGLREKLEAIEKLVEDGYLDKIVSSAYGNAYILTEKGEDANNLEWSTTIRNYFETPSDEDLKLEILLRMTDYYDGGYYKWLNNYDVTKGAVKHFANVPESMIEDIKNMLVSDFLIEKGSGGTFRLTNKGYDKAMGWFEENLPEEEEEANQYDFPKERQDQVLQAVYDAERNFDRFVTLDEIYNELLPNLPANYPKSGIGGEPTLEKDLQILEGNNLVIRRLMTLPKIGAEYAINPSQSSLIGKLLRQRAKAQKTTTPTTQTPQYNLPQDRLENILKSVSRAISKENDYVTNSQIWDELAIGNFPDNYFQYGLSVGFATLENDLDIMEERGLVRSRKYLDSNTTTLGGDLRREYYIDTKGSEMLTQLKLEEAQQQKASSLRPSPSESATLFPTGTIRFGNDGNQWRVTETKNGVKRWTKFGDIPSDEPAVEEPPISEITEDEVDLDLLEQQLNDDSLEFDLNEEDLDNLEF